MRRRAIMIPTVLKRGGVTTYTISGTVYDADGTTAVASATVALGALTATSGADGTYTISNVPPGTSGSMTCTKTGYSWAAITVSAMAANLASQNFVNAWYAGGGSLAICAAAYQSIGAANIAASYVNLVAPGTNNLTAPSAPGIPSFDASTGWTFAAASGQYLKTGVTPASGYSMIARFSGVTDGVNNQYLGGMRNTTGNRRYYLLLNTLADTVVYGSGGAVAVTPELLSGVIAVAGQQGYRNGTADGAEIAAWDTPNNAYPVDIGASSGDASGNPTGGTYLSGSIQAFAIYSNTLTPTQVGIITTAMAALSGPP